MSFWSGVAQGFRDSEARRERDMERASRQEERDYNRSWQERMFEYRQKQDQYVRDRQSRLDTIAMEDRKRKIKTEQEALKLTRIQTFLPYMNNPNLVNAFSGSGSSSDLTPMSPEAIAAGSNAYILGLQDLTDEQKNDPFFKALAQSKDGQAAVVGFISAQAEKGNTIPLKDIPQYFKYVGATQGANVEQTQEFLKSMVEGSADITDTDTFIRGLVTLNQYKPVQHIFQQTDAPTDTSDLMPEYNAWKTILVNEARRAADNDPERKDDINGAIAKTLNTETESSGLYDLIDLGIGHNLLDERDFADNLMISAFYDDVSEQPEMPDPINPTEEPEARVFDTWEEAEKAQQEGFSGPAIVAGQRGVIQSVQNISDISPENSENDFIEFGDRATEIIEQSVEEVNSTDTYYNELANTVKDELIEAGIVWPTNEQELDHFIEDINEAVESFGLNIPQEVLDMVMDQAAQNAIPLNDVEPRTENEKIEQELRKNLRRAERAYKLDWSHGKKGNPSKLRTVENAQEELDDFLNMIME